jgi:hypothetical protein
MIKDKTVITKQGKVVIWEHTGEAGRTQTEQKYASKFFNKAKKLNVFKIHSSSRDLDLYIDSLNIPVVE